MANWLTDLLNRTVSKEASQTETNSTQEFERKVQSSDWLKETMSLDEEKIAAAQLEAFNEFATTLKAEYGVEPIVVGVDAPDTMPMGETPIEAVARLAGKYNLTKVAAYERGDDSKTTIEKDYVLAVEGMSDYNIAEMLTALAVDAGEVALEASAAKVEKNIEWVKNNRKAAETKLLKQVGEHTLLDWKKKFSEFKKNETPLEPKEKELTGPEFEPGKQNWKKKVDFDAPSDKEKLEQMEGIGHEEEKGQVAKDASLKTANDSSCKKCWRPLEDDGSCSDKTCKPEEKKAAVSKDAAFADAIAEALMNGKEFIQTGYGKKSKEGVMAMIESIIEDSGPTKMEAPKSMDAAPMVDEAAAVVASKVITLEKKAFHAGDKVYYHGQAASIIDISLNQYSGEANVDIEVNGEKFTLAGKELKQLGEEALMPESEHPEVEPKDSPMEAPLPKEDAPAEPAADAPAPFEEIASTASKADVMKKVAEIQSPWEFRTDAQGNEVVARVAPDMKTSVVAEEEKDLLK